MDLCFLNSSTEYPSTHNSDKLALHCFNEYFLSYIKTDSWRQLFDYIFGIWSLYMLLLRPFQNSPYLDSRKKRS